MKKEIILLLEWIFIIYTAIIISIIILERKKPEKTIAWLLVLVLLPPIGLILYLFLGRNWKKHTLYGRFSPIVNEVLSVFSSKIEEAEYLQLIELLAKNSDAPLFIDNEITIFKDGGEKFKALKEELIKATHHIHLEYFIVKNDHIGNEIKDILINKAREGIEVRFIMDRVGSVKVTKQYIKELKEAGVDVVQYSYFLAPLLRTINTQINYRNHRKIVVIDGMVGFFGGINIGDEYLGKGRLGYWRDTHLMVKGDFVKGLQATFLEDFCAIKRANGNKFFCQEEVGKYCPEIVPGKGKVMQLVQSGPDYEFYPIMQCVLKMISMAQKHIYITSPYFVPTESILEALKVAALGGIDIRILFPGKPDHYLVYYASRTYLAELIKCGAKVYYYDKNAFVHSKVVTVDGKVATVGTANMDIRSFMLNYEVNAVIYDEEVTNELERQFMEDLQRSKLITEEYYKNASPIVKAAEAVARVFSFLL